MNTTTASRFESWTVRDLMEYLDHHYVDFPNCPEDAQDVPVWRSRLIRLAKAYDAGRTMFRDADGFMNA